MTEQTDRAGQVEQDDAEVPWWRRTRDAEAFAEAQRRLRRPMTVLSLVFTGSLVYELTSDLDPATSQVLLGLNVAIWFAFVGEYLWLLRLAPDRGRFVRTHLLDLIIVLLPMLRPLRALRLLRVLAVAARSWHEVFSVLRHRGLGKIISSVGALMLVGGVITFALEPSTFTTVGDAIWWVLVTSTTVGYGDFAPVGTPARIMAMVIMLLGIGLVGVITANIVDYMSADTRGPDPAAVEGAGGRSGHGAGGRSGHGACPDCRELVTRLDTIEAQLDRLLAQDPDPPQP